MDLISKVLQFGNTTNKENSRELQFSTTGPAIYGQISGVDDYKKSD